MEVDAERSQPHRTRRDLSKVYLTRGNVTNPLVNSALYTDSQSQQIVSMIVNSFQDWIAAVDRVEYRWLRIIRRITPESKLYLLGGPYGFGAFGNRSLVGQGQPENRFTVQN